MSPWRYWAALGVIAFAAQIALQLVNGWVPVIVVLAVNAAAVVALIVADRRARR